MFREKTQQRSFKKNIDANDSRRRRGDAAVMLRKEAREEQMHQRRRMGDRDDKDDGKRMQTSEIKQKLEQLPQLINGVNSDNPQKQLDCTIQFRKLLSIEDNPPIAQIIESGVVPRLIQFLTFTNHPVLQFEAAWAITNIASGTSKQCEHIIQHGCIRIFVHLLQSPDEDVREQAVWALGNIAGDSPKCRDLVLQSSALHPLMNLCGPDTKLTLLRNVTWALSNLCRGKPQPPFEAIYPALPLLVKLTHHTDDEILTDACWALSYISDDSEPNLKIQAIIDAGVVRKLVELLRHKTSAVIIPALRTLGNIVTGDDNQTQAVLNCHVLPALAALMVHPKKGIRKEACWTISNITAGNSEQIQLVIQANIIPTLISILRNAEFDIQKEAAWAISNSISGGNDDQIRYLVEQGAIPSLCGMFTCSDAKTVLVALESVDSILRVGATDAPRNNGVNRYCDIVEECGGLDSLERLQRHEAEEVYNQTTKMLKGYFEGDDEPAADESSSYGNFGQTNFQVPSGGFSFGS